MDPELKKALDALAGYGIKIDVPAEGTLTAEAGADILAQVNAINAQLEANKAAAQAGYTPNTPALHFKDAKGTHAAIRHLQDKMGMQLNTPMSSGRTGYGDEVTPSEDLSQEIFEMVPEYQTFLGRLPGQHNDRIARNVGDSVTVPIIGMPGKMIMEAEKTADSAFAVPKQTHAIATDKVTLTTKKFVARYDITRELADFSLLNAANWENRIKGMAAAEWTRTFESAIINGDTATDANTNINLIDGTPGSTEHYLACDGLRKTAIACTSPNGDPSIGDIDTGDVYTMKKVVGNYFKPSQFLWLSDMTTRDKFSTLDNFTDASKRGDKNTVENGPVDRLAGADYIIHDDFPTTNTAGKVSGTASNNTKGGIVGFWTPAVQYGWIGTLFFKLYDFGSQGFVLEFWGYGAISVVNQKAGATNNSTVVYGINGTI
jgi:hypothetical protein